MTIGALGSPSERSRDAVAVESISSAGVSADSCSTVGGKVAVDAGLTTASVDVLLGSGSIVTGEGPHAAIKIRRRKIGMASHPQ